MFFVKEKKPIRWQTYLKRIGLLVLLLFLYQLAEVPMTMLALPHLSLPWIIFILICSLVAVALIIWYAWYCYQKVYQQVSHKITKSNLYLIIGSYLVTVVMSQAFIFLNSKIYGQEDTANDVVLQTLMSHNSIILVTACIFGTFVAPIVEELIFRGFLMKGILVNLKPVYVIIISGLLFSSVHLSSNPISFALYATMGMILAYVFAKTDKIEASITVHMINNAVALIPMLWGVN
ncbi:CPBP family intramembrane glutamic endopeptidase [Convivina intestini]|uniref:CAAX prenyl protease 2/Lysostaphin resistance protein A-like domain-containing protein n=1 Tax=Convivina intestini TaxID=1505726 RepID=A0A2U1D595_9LACO|nr:CPBP family intramembrane glutamic endopeptidase [Convivina intestini]PVY82848.1 hypothetical protein C7384_11042 [Convivina intestini]CAH1856889.1 hypothetical protein R077811_01364 [Convivina intestini]SDC11339.1 hypothetical protein SAMN05216341_1138 [Leuconostocaceae bacterium R-53105]